MKLFLSLLLVISFFLASPTRILAAGQACCTPGWSMGLTAPSLDPNKCCNVQANFCVDSYCGSTETCSNNVCVAPAAPAPTAVSTPTITSTPTPTPTSNLPSTCCYESNPGCAGTPCGVSGIRCGRSEACALVNSSMAPTGLTPCTTHQQCYATGYSGCTWDGRINYCAALGYPTADAGSFGDSSDIYAKCVDGSKGIQTALGCISFDAEGGGFVRSLLGIIIGLGGGVALLLILYGVFIVTTSAGIPDKLNQGKEIISSAVAGLVFIILAIFLMNLIGIRILALPGLE